MFHKLTSVMVSFMLTMTVFAVAPDVWGGGVFNTPVVYAEEAIVVGESEAVNGVLAASELADAVADEETVTDSVIEIHADVHTVEFTEAITTTKNLVIRGRTNPDGTPGVTFKPAAANEAAIRFFEITTTTSGTFTFENIIFSDNRNNTGTGNTTGMTTSGGAITTVMPLVLTNCHFINNYATSGGAVYATRAVTATNCVFEGNSATDTGSGAGNGGALLVGQDAGSWTFTRCLFKGNSAGRGGALAYTNTSGGRHFYIYDSVFVGNTTHANAAGVENNVSNSNSGASAIYHNHEGYISAVNTIFYDNHVLNPLSGMQAVLANGFNRGNNGNARISLVHSTVVNNSGGIHHRSDQPGNEGNHQLNLYSNIIVGNGTTYGISTTDMNYRNQGQISRIPNNAGGNVIQMSETENTFEQVFGNTIDPDNKPDTVEEIKAALTPATDGAAVNIPFVTGTALSNFPDTIRNTYPETDMLEDTRGADGMATAGAIEVTPAAEGLVVTKGGYLRGPGSLQSVIAAAPAGSTITFDPSVSEIMLYEPISFAKEIEIKGNIDEEGNPTITLNGNSQARVVDVLAGASGTKLSNLTITNGRVSSGNGGGINVAAVTTIDNCRIIGNVAGETGGGIFISHTVNPTNGTGNVINNTLIQDNSAKRGGGLYVRCSGNKMPTFVYNSAFIGNSSTGTNGGGSNNYQEGDTGSAIYLMDNTDFYLANSIVANNYSKRGPEAYVSEAEGENGFYKTYKAASGEDPAVNATASGAIFSRLRGSPKIAIVHCTIINNNTHGVSLPSGAGNTGIYNSIIAGNGEGYRGHQVNLLEGTDSTQLKGNNIIQRQVVDTDTGVIAVDGEGNKIFTNTVAEIFGADMEALGSEMGVSDETNPFYSMTLAKVDDRGIIAPLKNLFSDGTKLGVDVKSIVPNATTGTGNYNYDPTMIANDIRGVERPADFVTFGASEPILSEVAIITTEEVDTDTKVTFKAYLDTTDRHTVDASQYCVMVGLYDSNNAIVGARMIPIETYTGTIRETVTFEGVGEADFETARIYLWNMQDNAPLIALK